MRQPIRTGKRSGYDVIMMPACRSAALAVRIFGLVLCFGPNAGEAQTRIESYHGSWTVRCNMQGSQTNVCAAASRKYETIKIGYNIYRIMVVVIRSRGGWYFQVIAPNWVNMSEDVRLELDGEFVSTIPFVGCSSSLSCYAQIPFSPALRKRFSNSRTARIDLDSGERGRFRMTFRLNGLEEAMKAVARR